MYSLERKKLNHPYLQTTQLSTLRVPRNPQKNPGTNQRALQGYIIQVKHTHTHFFFFFTVFLHSKEHMGIEIKNIIQFMSVKK